MTKTFERFLRSFSDEDLASFVRDRGRVRPPYWKAMRLALQVEAARRDLRFDQELDELLVETAEEPDARSGTA